MIIAQAGPRPADTRVLRAHAPHGSGIRMRSWPIRRKLVAIPILAAVLLTVATWVALASGGHRFWLVAGLDAQILALMVAAWAAADALAQRIVRLREQVAQLRDRGAVPNASAVGELRRSTEFLEFAQAAGGFGVFDLDLVTGRIIGTPLYFELLGIPNSAALFTRDEWLATVH